jgi:hypothetical protein
MYGSQVRCLMDERAALTYPKLVFDIVQGTDTPISRG